MKNTIIRGDMFYAALSGIGSEQNGCRPVLVIQNNTGNRFSKTVIVAVITSRMMNKAKLPTHVFINAQQGLKYDSLILLEQVKTIDKRRLRSHIGILSNECMNKVDKALAVSVGFPVKFLL